jgi:hypothetical protein
MMTVWGEHIVGLTESRRDPKMIGLCVEHERGVSSQDGNALVSTVKMGDASCVVR